MLKDRKELENYLEKQCERIVFNKEESDRIVDYLKKKYKYPSGMTMNIISGRIGLQMVGKLILFFMLDGICNEKLTEYFTPSEIAEMENAKYVDPHAIEWPLRIKIMQVSDDQWIGAASAGFYIGLVQDSKIRYNENTQRVMKKIVKNEEVEFKIELNKTAVGEISESMKQNTFIPNTLTLNIPEDVDSKFYYNKEEMELVINSIDTFDILDGYHRLIGICNNYNDFDGFDYPMELRITNYPEQKARQFIFQEDQKTKMRRIDSESMDANSDSNYVVERLNSDMDSNLKGMINRNNGKINYSEMSAIIKKIFFKKKTTKKIEVLKFLKQRWNLITDDDSSILDKRIELKRLYCILAAMDIYEDEIDLLKEKVNKINSSDIINVEIVNLSGTKAYNQIVKFVKEV